MFPDERVEQQNDAERQYKPQESSHDFLQPDSFAAAFDILEETPTCQEAADDKKNVFVEERASQEDRKR